MLLKLNESKPGRVFSPVEVSDGYIGTTTEYQPGRMISANVQTAESRLNAELYGERVSEMLTLYLCRPYFLEKGEAVAIGLAEKPTHKVIDCKHYRLHTVALAEVIRHAD